jgi:hypothetical protein
LKNGGEWPGNEEEVGKRKRKRKMAANGKWNP